ncbi:MAG: hypothetical protein J6P19_04705 [Acetobacter sp.]|nr:hypothetical protein [Acetobacter sp.]
MSSLTSKLKKATGIIAKGTTAATRTAVNPLYPLTDKAANKIIPGYGSKVSNLITNITDPFSETNKGLTKAAIKSINPLNTIEAAQQAVEAVKQATAAAKSQNQKIVPDRESYAASASSAAAAAARAAAEAQKQKIVPDRESYAINASKKEVITNIAKQAAEANAQNAEQTNALQYAEANDNASTAASTAAQFATTNPQEIRIILDAGDSARAAAEMEQQLPEVEVKSDFTKYLLWGGLALAAFYFLRKKK